MARAAAPLPTSLGRGAFSVAEARRLDVSLGRLRGSDLHRPTRGLRSLEAATGLDERAHQVWRGLPQPCAWSHLTAARLYRLPLPRPWSTAEPLHVTRPTSSAQVRRPGVVGHRGLEQRTVVTLCGHPVTSEAWTWADLASLDGMSFLDLVVAGDAFVARVPDLLPELAALAAGADVRRGVRMLRRAAALLRVDSGSPMETRARLVFADAGLPEAELNGVISGEDGQFIARGDFVWRAAMVVVEYEGDQHRTDRRQWQGDIARTRLLEALGWKVVRITAADLHDPRSRRELLDLLRGLLS